MMRLTLFAILMAAFVTLQCTGQNEVSGGSTVETTNSFSGVVLDTGGAPAVSALVYFLPSNYDPVKDAAKTDALVDTTNPDGSFSFEEVKKGKYTLEARDSLSLTRLVESGISINEDIEYPEVSLRRTFGYTVELPPGEDHTGTYVYIPGTTIMKTVEPGTDYITLDAIPVENRPAVNYGHISSGISGLPLETSVILVENFEDGDERNELDQLTGKGMWELLDESALGGTAILPAEALADFSQALASTGAYKGTSLHLKFACDDTPYAYAKTFIGPRTDLYADLTQLTAITFYINVNRPIRLLLVSSKGMNYSPDQQWGQIGSFISATGGWQKVTLQPEDLAPPPGSQQETDGLTWEAVRDSIRSISFRVWETPSDTVELWLDEIYLHGVSESSFIQ